MWYVGTDLECPKDVKFKFADAREHLLDVALEINNYDVVSLAEDFYDVIDKLLEINPKFRDKINCCEDYYYYIVCDTEEEAELLAEQMNEQCELIWEKIENSLEEYYEEYYEEEEEEEIII